MRNAFADEITALASDDSRVILLSGDIGNRLFDSYNERCPNRFINCGVAEANMIGMASGMALSGLRPIVYTINSFVTVRCLEQIRVDVCYHHTPVIIVGVGAGLSYASLGGTHHSCEDIALLRVMPEMTVVCPGDPIELRLALRAALRHSGPVFIRMGKKGEPIVHKEPPPFTFGKAIVIQPGRDICLLSTGNVLPLVLKTAAHISQQGVVPEVVSFHTVKPLDEELLARVFSSFTVVVTIEEHSLLGGFGGSVAEWLADHPVAKAKLVRIGTTDKFFHETGEQEFARKRLGLTPENIAERALQTFRSGVPLPSKQK